MRKRHIIYFFILVFFVSCPEPTSRKFPVVKLAQLEEERLAWENQAIKHYRFSGKCFSNYRGPGVLMMVTVLQDTEPEILFIDKEEERQYAEDIIESRKPFDPFDSITIDDLYVEIKELMEDYKNRSVYVQYNQTYHYPEYVTVFTYMPKGYKGGDARELEIIDFEVLQ